MLTEKCVKLLTSYRTNCASSTAPGQLILPESFKLFPVYALAMLKSRALRAGVNTDTRVHEMRMFKNMGVGSTIVLLYPKMMDLNEMSENVSSMERVFLLYLFQFLPFYFSLFWFPVNGCGFQKKRITIGCFLS
jgi:hypothetical protein